MEIKNVTFIGLGVMGYNMAGHLIKKNFNTTVYNRTPSVADKWVNEFSGTSALTPGQAVENADIVFICVGKDEDLISVMEADDGIINNLKNGTIVVDHGHGVKSIYAHLSRVGVKVNDIVSQNDILGTVGSTGRSTGPHLHWGVMVFDTYVDPELLLSE